MNNKCNDTRNAGRLIRRLPSALGSPPLRSAMASGDLHDYSYSSRLADATMKGSWLEIQESLI